MLWIPGPTEVRPEILAECARPMIGHRSPRMGELLERIDPGLHLAFGVEAGSSARTAVHSVSATGLMEASLIGAGNSILAVVNGAFSKRWKQIAELLGKRVHALEVPWGQAVESEHLERALHEHGPFDAVTLVSSETSTGVATPLDGVARVLARHPRTLLLVDLVSWIAGAAVDFDRRGLDFAFAGVQKALALPPGISVFCVSEHYLDRARHAPHRGYTLDPVQIVEGHVARKTPATPCISLHYALARQLEDITSGVTLPEQDRHLSGNAAWKARYAKHARMRTRTLAWARSHGLDPFCEENLISPTVSCIRSGSVDAGRLVAGLKERGFEISNGYGDLKGQTFRIGHMGDHTEAGLEELLAAADDVLA
jgi:aspartate aminotransferase-like enzyme